MRQLFAILCFGLFCNYSQAGNYQVFVDANGGLYLKAPVQTIVLPDPNPTSERVTPVQITPANGLLKLVNVNGVWQVESLSRAEWDSLNLQPSDDAVDHIRSADFDGNGQKELLIALNRPDSAQLVLNNLFGNVRVAAQSSRLVSTAVLPDTQPNPATVPGSMAGEFRVDESGTANYSMPLNLPEGIAGVKPQLTFNYSSGQGDGYMGSGWSFGGASLIGRCPKNMATDAVQGNVSFSAADRLCLNGQRLVKNGAQNDKVVSDTDYWSSSTQFHTELDSFVLVRQHGTSVQGPKAFTVETKSGEIHYYGDVAAVTGSDSMGKALSISLKDASGSAETGADAFFDTSDGSNLARLWALKAIKDVKGNYILFKYIEDQNLGEHYLSEVHYTGRTDGKAPFAKVVLNYADNPKKAIGWHAGQRVGMTRLLETVDVTQDNKAYRQYRLSYFRSTVLEEKNYLLSVQECAGADNLQCLPATRFEWNRPPAVTTTTEIHCEDIQMADPECWEKPVTTTFSPFTATAVKKGSSAERWTQKLMDINGDGYADMVYVRDGSWRARLGGTSGWDNSCATPAGEPLQCAATAKLGSFSTEVTLSTSGVAKKQYAQTIDYNGDGQRDLLVANAETENWKILSYQPTTSTVTHCNQKGEVCEPLTITTTFKEIDTGLKAVQLESGAIVADYDGDGLEDIIFLSNNEIQAYRNKGSNADNIHQGFEHQGKLGITGGSSELTGAYTRFNADQNATSSVDVNGDGRTDILTKVTEGWCTVAPRDERFECRRRGGVWKTKTTLQLFVSTGSGYTNAQEMDNYTHVRIADLNGDGYSDLLYQIAGQWYYRLSDGTQFIAPQMSNLNSNQTLIDNVFFIDLNSDGRSDVLLPITNSQWSIYLSRPANAHDQIVFESRGSRSFTKDAVVQFADMDADGKLDLLTATDDSGWNISLNSRTHIKDHSIRKITTGTGVGTWISYLPITHPDVYLRQDTANRAGSDYFSPRAGFSVVSDVSTETNTNQFVSVSYQYGGLLLHKKGRGLLGFELLRTRDNQSGVVTESLYHQVWPYTGMPKSTLQTRNGLLLSEASNSVDSITTTTGGVLPYIQSSTEKSYSLNTALNESTHLNTTSSSFVYDADGNLTSSTVTQSDPSNGGNKLVTTTSNIFNKSPAYQRYGRMTASTVNKTLFVSNSETSNISRSSEFNYNTDYLLETETYAANLAAAKSVTTYGYDAAGNKTSISVKAAAGPDGTLETTRSSSTTYTDNLRYVATSTDAMGQVSTYYYNGKKAAEFTPDLIQSVAVLNPNNQRSTTNFDVFGQSTSSAAKGALQSDTEITGTVSRSFCNSCESLFPYAYIKVTTSNVTGAEQQQFIDKYGREIGSKTKLPLTTGYSVTSTTYDAQGRVEKSYEPALESISSNFSQAYYDALGRVYQTNAANGGISSVSYAGYTTTSTDALSKTRSSTVNYLGQQVSSTDHNNTALTFSYNAYGDLLTARALNVTRVSNVYDAYGRKTAMTDIDKGTWSYKTNGFAEMVSQTNAESQTTRFEYNNLGQLTRRYDPSGTVCWSYGATAAAYNVNQLTAVKQWNSNDTDCNSTAATVYAEGYTYNSKALVNDKTITTAGGSYVISSAYDSYGRPSVLTYPTVGSISGLSVRTDYSNGVAYKQTDTNSNTVYLETTEFNGRGQGTTVKYGNGVSSSFVYEAETGWLKSSATKKGSTTIQSYDYDFDDTGNVIGRELSYGVGSNGNLKETFGYDDLHRLTSRTVTAAVGFSGSLSMSEDYTYDKLGNLKTKTGVGIYNFAYDDNGNITNDGKRSFMYTAFEKPYKITQGSDSTDFSYGPNRELISRIDKRGGNTTTTLMLDGIYEQVTLPTGITEHKYYVGDAVVTKRSNSTTDTFYLHKDQQGSTTAITNAAGTIVQQLMYDPWGKQFLVNNSILTYSSPAQSKGYTGHEMVNDFEVIHMGGRTYNPTLGRFMQADPFIQQPGNLQSYNRYAYVQNNPMSYTDPSGYFLKKLMQVTGVTAAMKFLASNAFLNGIVMVALNFIPGCQGWCSAAFAAAQSYAVTGSLGGAMRAGLFAYVGAGVGALGNFGGLAGFAASGMAGGLLSVLQGGKFGHGFVSAGLGASLGGLGGRVSNPLGQVLVSAVIGGTISKVTGGKFINGAGSAAFAAALRADWGKTENSKDAQYAQMSEKAYKGNRGDKVGDYTIEDIHEDDTGLRAALFVDGSGHKVLAYAGTDFSSWSDWKANLLQGLGFESAQYTNAIDIAQEYGAITFTGHSLGGGLASIAAMRTGGAAIVFNAAGLHDNTIGDINRSRGNITHYHSGYDAVRLINAVTPTSVPGTQINLGIAGWHNIGSMCKAMGTSC